jgi:hypothetical protein
VEGRSAARRLGADYDSAARWSVARQFCNPPSGLRKRVKRASRELLAASKTRLADLERFWEKEQTKGEVETLILDHVCTGLPAPPLRTPKKT